MISSWRYLAINEEPLAERDFVNEKANAKDQHRVRACLDQAVLTLNAGGNPFEALANLPGMRLITVTSEQRNPFRIFVRRHVDVLVVLGITRGGDNDSIKPIWRSDVTKRLNRLLSEDVELAEPGPLPELSARKSGKNRRKARMIERDQTHSNILTEFKAKSRTPVSRRSSPVPAPSKTPIGDLLKRTQKLDLYLRTLESTASGKERTPIHQEVQRILNSPRAAGKDIHSEWTDELKQCKKELTDQALEKSPLPTDAEPRARFQAGLQVLLAAEAPQVKPPLGL